MMDRMPLRRIETFPLPGWALPAALGVALLVWFIIDTLITRDALLPLLVLTFGCLGLLVVVHPVLGLPALVVSAAIIDVSIDTGTGTPIVASLLCGAAVVGGWAVHRVLVRRTLWTVPRLVSLWSLLLIGAMGFAFLWGRATLDPRITMPENFYRVQLAQYGLFIISLGLLFVGGDLLRDRGRRNLLVGGMIAIGCAALPFRWFGDVPFSLNSAGIFGLWFIALTWSNALVNDRISTVWRFALAAVSIGWLLMAIVREGSWVSGWLPGLIAILAVTIIARPRLGVVVSLIAALALLGYFSVFYDLLITTQAAEGSIGGPFGRLALIERNIGFLGTRLLIGIGPAGYALYYVAFIPHEAMSTHNNYIEVLAQGGVVALVSLIGLLGTLFVLGVRKLRTISEGVDRAQVAAVIGALPGLMVALNLGDWLLPFVYNQTIAGFNHSVYSWLMLAMLCGLLAQPNERAGDRV